MDIYEVMERLVICKPSTLDTGCWEWSGGTNNDGYGQANIGKVKQKVHRVMYEHFIGKIPEGLETDHLCRNRKCANPYHLEPVTHQENTLRGFGITAQNARKTECKQGHPLNEENTYLNPRGGRRCRICATLNKERWKNKHRIDPPSAA